MILLKDLAFVNFQNNLSIGLKISSEKHKEMVDAITTHIKWMQASETKELSFTQLSFFHLSFNYSFYNFYDDKKRQDE